MEITFVLHLITVCAFLIVSIALSFKFIVEAVLDYKEVTSGIKFVLENSGEDSDEDEDTSRW